MIKPTGRLNVRYLSCARCGASIALRNDTKENYIKDWLRYTGKTGWKRALHGGKKVWLCFKCSKAVENVKSVRAAEEQQNACMALDSCAHLSRSNSKKNNL